MTTDDQRDLGTIDWLRSVGVDPYDLDELWGRIRQMRRALEPFADVAETIPADTQPGHCIHFDHYAMHYRRAARALAGRGDGP